MKREREGEEEGDEEGEGESSGEGRRRRGSVNLASYSHVNRLRKRNLGRRFLKGRKLCRRWEEKCIHLGRKVSERAELLKKKYSFFLLVWYLGYVLTVWKENLSRCYYCMYFGWVALTTCVLRFVSIVKTMIFGCLYVMYLLIWHPSYVLPVIKGKAIQILWLLLYVTLAEWH